MDSIIYLFLARCAGWRERWRVDRTGRNDGQTIHMLLISTAEECSLGREFAPLCSCCAVICRRRVPSHSLAALVLAVLLRDRRPYRHDQSRRYESAS